jgi:hypothetical protein
LFAELLVIAAVTLQHYVLEAAQTQQEYAGLRAATLLTGVCVPKVEQAAAACVQQVLRCSVVLETKVIALQDHLTTTAVLFVIISLAFGLPAASAAMLTVAASLAVQYFLAVNQRVHAVPNFT